MVLAWWKNQLGTWLVWADPTRCFRPQRLSTGTCPYYMITQDKHHWGMIAAALEFKLHERQGPPMVMSKGMMRIQVLA